jgi:hypothetical protein
MAVKGEEWKWPEIVKANEEKKFSVEGWEEAGPEK